MELHGPRGWSHVQTGRLYFFSSFADLEFTLLVMDQARCVDFNSFNRCEKADSEYFHQ